MSMGRKSFGGGGKKLLGGEGGQLPSPAPPIGVPGETPACRTVDATFSSSGQIDGRELSAIS